MPEKEEKDIWVDFTPTQRKNYEKLYDIAKERYLYYKTLKNVGRGYIDILSSLHPARQACSGYECNVEQIEQQLADAQAKTYQARALMQQAKGRELSKAEIFSMAKEDAFQDRTGECAIWY